jgi:hypothetical protein
LQLPGKYETKVVQLTPIMKTPAIIPLPIIFSIFGMLLCVTGFPVKAEIIYLPLPGLDQAKQKALAIDCWWNLHEIFFAAERWSSKHGDQFPSDFQVFTNEMESPEILFCPADQSRAIPTNWANVDWTKIDYTWIAQTNWYDLTNTCCNCRIHTQVLHVDGTVDAGRERPGWPAIIAGPSGLWASPGSDVPFRVRVAPNALLPLSYQWRRDHLSFVTNVTFLTNQIDPVEGYWLTNRLPKFAITNLNGETNDTLELHNVQTNDADYYSVAVSNSMGTTVSQANLKVDAETATLATNEQFSEIVCLNNLRQIALLAELWSSDHNERMPQSLEEMTNWFGSPIFGWPVVIYCPSDKDRTIAEDWPDVNLDDTSYEVFPTQPEDECAVFCRCKIHGFYVQQNGIAISHPSFAGIHALTNNIMDLDIQIFAGKTNLLEASSDLITWTNLETFSATNGILSVHETNNASQRFYRIRLE